MSYIKQKTVLPIYLVGATWLVWALVGSLDGGMDYLLCALVSVAVYKLGKIIFPDKGYQVGGETAKAEEKPQTQSPKEEAKPAHSPEIQALITERDKAVSEMRRLNDSIKDETISANIDRLELLTGKITDAVVAEPSKLPQIRKFMNYYLPTTLKLLNAYDRMDSAGVDGANITGTKGKIEDMLSTICDAFEKQLDSLFGTEALDISTDITVMEQMLAQEGLGGTQMPTGDGA